MLSASLNKTFLSLSLVTWDMQPFSLEGLISSSWLAIEDTSGEQEGHDNTLMLLPPRRFCTILAVLILFGIEDAVT